VFFSFANSAGLTYTFTLNSITCSVYRNGVAYQTPSVSTNNGLSISKGFANPFGTTTTGTQYYTNASISFPTQYANTTDTYQVYLTANNTFTGSPIITINDPAGGRYGYFFFNCSQSAHTTFSGNLTFNDADGVGYSAVSISETLYNDTTNSILTNNIYSNNINNTGLINTGTISTGLINTGTISTTGDITLNGIGCNILNMYAENGQQFVSIPYTTYSNWGGKVGYCISSGLTNNNAGYNNVYSTDFICNSGSMNYSTWNFYAVSQTGQPIGLCFNSIVNAGYAHTSDKTTKQNIKSLNTKNSLTKVLQLRPVTYQYIDDSSFQQIGFISQEVEEITPATADLPFKKDASGNTTFKKALFYNDLFIHNIGATQELYKMIEVLQEQVATLQDQIAKLTK
jgi:hypothetical protein